MDELTALTFKVFFDLGLTAREFNRLDPKDQALRFNDIRFHVKAELLRRPTKGSYDLERVMAHLDNKIADILFE
jgi:hypothetical protein